jgi:hypothetical protein
MILIADNYSLGVYKKPFSQLLHLFLATSSTSFHDILRLALSRQPHHIISHFIISDLIAIYCLERLLSSVLPGYLALSNI